MPSFAKVPGRVGLGLASGLGAIALLPALPVLAQIAPDGTLGGERSQVIPNVALPGGAGILIDGGARRGANLFQSFRDFNVGDLQCVYFANPAGVESILGRVTGGNPSNIFGTLGVLGSANLFLLNPQGLVFGPNARLDVRGAFVASTAAGWDLGNGQSFNALHPNAAPLIEVAIQPGFQAGGLVPNGGFQGDLTQAGSLAVDAGQTLALMGRTVTNTGSLVTPGGTVQVLGDRVALLNNTRIDVSGQTGGGTVLIGGDLQGGGGVPQSIDTRVDANVRIHADAIGQGNGGKVIVWAQDHTQFAGTISARGGDGGGNGGFVEVSGKQTLAFNGLVDTTARNGKLGILLLDPFDLTINAPEAAAISSATADVVLTADNNITFNAPINNTNLGVGIAAEAGNNIFVNSDIGTNAGDIRLFSINGSVFLNNASIDPTAVSQSNFSSTIVISGRDRVEIRNSSLDNRQFNDTATAGNAIGIVAREGSVLIDNTYISTTNTGTGDAGLVLITGRNRVDILNSRNPDSRRNGPGIFSRGNGGEIIIGGVDDPSLAATFPTPKTIRISNSRLNVDNDTGTSGTVTSGDISLRASDAIILDTGARISSSTFRQGNTGAITLSTDNGVISLDNNSVIFNTVESGGVGNAGDITVDTRSLSLNGKSELQTLVRAGGQGNAGEIIIRASDSVTLGQNSGIFSQVEQGATGNAGGVGIKAGSLLLTGQSEINTSTAASGSGSANADTLTVGSAAGAVVLFVDGNITLDNSNIFNNLERGGSGDSGIILIKTGSLDLRNSAQIQTIVRGSGGNAPGAQGNAGNIYIYASDYLKATGFRTIDPAGNSGIFPSGLRSSVDAGAQGDSGRVYVQTPLLFLEKGAEFTVANFSKTGNAGDLIAVADFIVLDRNATLKATSVSGQGGNILLQTPYLVGVSRGSNIFTQAGEEGGGGNGGNVIIGADLQGVIANDFSRVFATPDAKSLLVYGFPNNDSNYFANAFSGNGGRIEIAALSFRNLRVVEPGQFSTVITNDVDASSKGGGLNGAVAISSFNLDPDRGLTPLGDRFQDPRISEGCDPRTRRATSQFTRTDKGAATTQYANYLPRSTAVALRPSPESPRAESPVPDHQPDIHPAQGWLVDAQGTLRLVAQLPNAPLPTPTPENIQLVCPHP